MNLAQILDHLIDVCTDSEKRYHHASLDVGKAYLERFFNEQSARRRRAADQLRIERARLGPDGNEAGTLRGLVDRAAMDFNVIMSMGDTGVVEWCRKDAQAVIDEYRAALAQDLPPHLRNMLERQLNDVRDAAAGLEHVLETYGGARS
jgi:uncharacterized protein (TIGR02284 family)